MTLVFYYEVGDIFWQKRKTNIHSLLEYMNGVQFKQHRDTVSVKGLSLFSIWILDKFYMIKKSNIHQN